MKTRNTCLLGILTLLAFLPLASEAQQAAATSTDIYHVMFVKATPGQAATLAEDLKEQGPDGALSTHFLLLRHVEGDDWDFCIIQHLGTETTVEAGPTPPPAGTPVRAWHDDTFVAGPSWDTFSRAMGLTDGPATSVYVVGVHQAVPGHRNQLLEALDQTDPESKVKGHATLAHVEGARWQLLSLDRYDSWPDFAADRTANSGMGEGWLEVREHSAFHRDTLAERVR
jgi:hypothetical protein